MNVLLTGSSGYLGKYVLRTLLKSPQVQKIMVTSRKCVRFPVEYADKIHAIRCDLSDPSSFEILETECRFKIDAVIHLAGNYNFNRGIGALGGNEDYIGNVVPLLHLVPLIRKWNCPIFFASSYVTQLHYDEITGSDLTGPTLTYQDTKRICESLIVKSGCPGSVFRLGILVGDSKTGYIEKTDGPYAFMSLLNRLKRLGYKGIVPVFADSESILPLVPVDEAASCITQRLFEIGKNTVKTTSTSALASASGLSGGLQFISVYRPDSVSVGTFTNWACQRLAPRIRPNFLDWNADVLSRFQERFTDVPSESLRMARMKIKPIDETSIQVDKGLSSFDDYKEKLLSGFLEFNGYEPTEVVHQS